MDMVKKKLPLTKACFMLLVLNGILMMTTIGLVVFSWTISEAKSCDLEQALDLIKLEVTAPCKYNDIKHTTGSLFPLGLVSFFLSFVFFIWIFVFISCCAVAINDEQWNAVNIVLLVAVALSGLAAAFAIAVCVVFYSASVFNAMEDQRDVDYDQLRLPMKNWLEAYYTSDTINSNDEMSNRWNKFFIKYECCAVNQVQGTTNDFEQTPWCTDATLAGTCQTTASQIPRTCCNYVTEDDYESAPSTCHSSVNPGTYKSSCLATLKSLSVENVNEMQVVWLLVLLLTTGVIQIFVMFTSGYIIGVLIYNIQKYKVENKGSDNKDQNDEHQQRNKAIVGAGSLQT